MVKGDSVSRGWVWVSFFVGYVYFVLFRLELLEVLIVWVFVFCVFKFFRKMFFIEVRYLVGLLDREEKNLERIF